MNNIFIIGKPLDLYRTQAFVKAVMTEFKDWNLSISYFSCTRQKHNNIISSISRKFMHLIELQFDFINILRSDYVYVTAQACNCGLQYKIEFLYARFLKKKIIAEFYISTYDTFVLDCKLYKDNTKIASKLKKLDIQLQSSYRVIYLNSTEAVRYSSIVGLNISNLNSVIIPLTIKARQEVSLPYYNKHSEIFNIFWWGTYIPLHGLDRIIEMMKFIVTVDKNVHLYIMGNSDEKAKPYLDLIHKLQIDEFITVRNDYTFRNGLLESCIHDKADLALGSFGESEKAKTVILNKCIEAVSMNIPVMTQYSPAFQEFFLKDEKSIFYCNNTPEEMMKCVMDIKSKSKEIIDERLNSSFEIYRNYFSEERSLELYKEMLQNL